jgi:hypothetical protein
MTSCLFVLPRARKDRVSWKFCEEIWSRDADNRGLSEETILLALINGMRTEEPLMTELAWGQQWVPYASS